MTRYKKGPEHYYLQPLSVVVKYRCEPQVKRSNVLQPSTLHYSQTFKYDSWATI